MFYAFQTAYMHTYFLTCLLIDIHTYLLSVCWLTLYPQPLQSSISEVVEDIEPKTFWDEFHPHPRGISVGPYTVPPSLPPKILEVKITDGNIELPQVCVLIYWSALPLDDWIGVMYACTCECMREWLK
jgi:hypothetical protein